jgi:hypothetical protein
LRICFYFHHYPPLRRWRAGGGGGGGPPPVGRVYWRVKLIMYTADIKKKYLECTSKPQCFVMTSCLATTEYRPSMIYAVVTLHKVRHKAGLSTYMVNCLCICKGVRLKSKIERIEI